MSNFASSPDTTRTIFGRPLLDYLRNPCYSGVAYDFSVIKSGAWLVTFTSHDYEWPREALPNPKGEQYRPIQQLRWGKCIREFTVPYTVTPESGEELEAVWRAAMACFAYANYPGAHRRTSLTRTDETQWYYPWTPEECAFHAGMLKTWN